MFLMINFLLYSISFYFIIKRRKYSVVSVRSPTLLIMNNLGGFLMTTTFFTYEMVEKLYKDSSKRINLKAFCRALPFNYIVFHMLMMISFILRCHRIIECCKINYDERVEIKQFYKRRYLYKEQFYIKILFACMSSILLINLFTQIESTKYSIIPYHFVCCMEIINESQFYVSLSWIIINFAEDAILLTYTYLISINQIKQMIKFELYTFLLVWIIYPNALRLSDFLFNVDTTPNLSHWTSYICIGFLYICLFLNGYLPIILSYLDQTNISYHFNPKLTQSLYLFLSNEVCYYSFYEFMSTNERDYFFINLYTELMKYKIKFTTEPNFNLVLQDASRVYNKYFANNLNDTYLDFEMTNKIKNACQMLFNEECTYELFDEVLCVCYDYLEIRYNDYKKSDEYQILSDHLNLNSYIQCKMCNTGLINKF